MKFDILNRWSGKVQFTAEIDANELTPLPIKTGMALEWALWNIGDLSGAVFAGANIEEKSLSGIHLERAILTNANMRQSDLTDSVLNGTDFSGSDLTGVGLTNAMLRDTSFSRANLTNALLDFADLTGANLSRADLTAMAMRHTLLNGADLREADITDAGAPHIDGLDSQVLAALHAGGSLDVDNLQSSENALTRDDWAIRVAGPAGRDLEERFGPNVAAAFLYARAYPDLPVPDFFADDNVALADIKMRARLDAAALAFRPY